MKPDLAIFEYARCAAGTDNPAEIVYVGDSYDSDVAGAKNAGWQTVWLNPSGAEAAGDHADVTVKSLREVAELFG